MRYLNKAMDALLVALALISTGFIGGHLYRGIGGGIVYGGGTAAAITSYSCSVLYGKPCDPDLACGPISSYCAAGNIECCTLS